MAFITGCATITYNDWKYPLSGYPVPLVTIEQKAARVSDGPVQYLDTAITLEGKIFDPTPSDGISYTGMLIQAERLRKVFSNDGLLTISPLSGSNYASGAYPCKVENISFRPTPDNWTMSIDYSVSLSSQTRLAHSGQLIDSATNSWQLVPIEEYAALPIPTTGISGVDFTAMTSVPGLRVTHTINAVGKYVPSGAVTGSPSGYLYTKLCEAISWVNQNFSVGKPSFLDNHTCYDFIRNVDYNVVEGSYGITDTFSVYAGSGKGAKSGGYLDSYSVETSFDLESSLRTVSIEGTIQGLESYGTSFSGITSTFPYGISGCSGIPSNLSGISIRPPVAPSSVKFLNALSGLIAIRPYIYGRANGFNISGLIGPTGSCTGNQILNPEPKSSSIGYNPKEGVITYSFSYDTRPISLIPCALSESFSVNDTLPSQQVAEIFVIGRSLGPVLQDLATYTSPTRTVNYEVTLPRASSISGIIPYAIYSKISGIIEGFNPENTIPFTDPQQIKKMRSFVKENSETWDPINGKFTKNKSWIYTICEGTLDNLNSPTIG